jgi:hypothetical protein
MKIFVKAMEQNASGTNEAKIKAGIFEEPEIREIIRESASDET